MSSLSWDPVVGMDPVPVAGMDPVPDVEVGRG